MFLLSQDIQRITTAVAPHWQELEGRNLLVTGGTGFFGRWLLESFLRANAEFELGAKIWIVSRSPDRFLKTHPQFVDSPCIHWIQGDVRDFEFPREKFSHVIHAATDVVSPASDALTTVDVGYFGTRRIIDFCQQTGVEKLLMTSSGAVYGRQPLDLDHVPESYQGSPALDHSINAYTESKRIGEWLVLNASQLANVNVVVARCFAFIGPFMAPSGPFAVTDFMSRLLANQEIQIKGDGKTLRSYMYASDMATWLWQLLFRGPNKGIFNVGSDQAISIKDLAELMVEVTGVEVPIHVLQTAQPGARPERYVPSIEKAQSALGLTQEVDVASAIGKTWEYRLAKKD